jgi:hypothetical protein
MTTATKTALLGMLASPIGFLAGAAWGVFFGFPSPDLITQLTPRMAGAPLEWYVSTG